MGRVPDAGVGPLRVPPTELAIVHLGRERDPVAAALGHLEAEPHRVGGSGGDQTDIQGGTGRPGIALVDEVAVLVQQVGPVHVGALFHGTLSVVLHSAAPEDHLPPVVNGLKLYPDVEGVHGSAGEEMADVQRSHHHVHPHRIPAPHGGPNLVQGRHHFEWRSGDHAPGHRRIPTPSPTAKVLESCRLAPVRPEVSAASTGSPKAMAKMSMPTCLSLQEIDGGLELLLVLVSQGHGRIGAREPVRVGPCRRCSPGRGSPPGACGSPRTCGAGAGSRRSGPPGRKRRWPASCRSR